MLDGSQISKTLDNKDTEDGVVLIASHGVVSYRAYIYIYILTCQCERA